MSHPDDGMLAALLDGELTGDEQRMVEAHLRGCEVCRARLAEETAMMAEADGMVEELVLPPLERGAPVAETRGWWVRYRPLAWAATVVLAAGLGYYSGEWRQPAGGLSLPPAPTEASGAIQQSGQESATAVPPRATSPAAPTSPDAAESLVSRRMESQTEVPGAQELKAKDENADLAKAAGRVGEAREEAAGLRPDSVIQVPETRLIPRDQAATRQRVEGNYIQMEPPRPVDEEKSRTDADRFSGAAERLAAPPAASATPQTSFKASSLEDAVNALGGSILLIDGLSPDGVELNSDVPPVARVRYLYPSAADTVYLLQRRDNISGITSYGAYNNLQEQNIHGRLIPNDPLKSVRNGLVFRVSGTVSDSLLETLVPRIH